jgi:hypothetical protein
MKQSITLVCCALTVSRQIVLFCLVLLFFGGCIEQASADDQTPPNSVQVTFESFLTNPPVIERAEYEIINPPPDPKNVAQFKLNHPRAIGQVVLTNYCTLRLDQTNFILTRQRAYNGRFGSTEWMLMADTLRLADLRINTPDAIGPAVGDVRWPIRRFMNLGIAEMVSNTLEWAKGADHFTAKCQREILDESDTNYGEIDVQLHYVNGVPLTATTRDSFGRETEIQYRYASTFFDGKFPIGFDVMGLGPNGVTQKGFSLQIKQLQLSENPIGMAEFDPRIALKGSYRGLVFLSNNITYGVTRRGTTYPVMSLEESNQRMANAKAQRLARQNPSKGSVLRNSLVIALLVALVAILLNSFFKSKRT